MGTISIVRTKAGRHRHLVCCLFVLIMAFSYLTAQAEEWIDWHWISPQPQGMGLYDVAHGLGTTVVVGRAGTILWTDDLETWNLTPLDDSYGFFEVLWTGQRFVAIDGAGGAIVTSPDGNTWYERHAPTGKGLSCVHYGSQGLVAAGEGYVLTSLDGIEWSEHELEFYGIMTDIASSETQYVGIGARSIHTGRHSILVSDDGKSWRELPDIEDFELTGIVRHGERFIATGGVWPGEAFVLASEDGENWEILDHNLPTWLGRIETGDSRIAGMNYDFFASSSDAQNWTITEVPSHGELNGLDWVGDRFMIVGGSGYMSAGDDGAPFEMLRTRSVRNSAEDITIGEPGFVAVGTGLIFSEDGKEWSEHPMPLPGWHAMKRVAWGLGAYYAVSDGGLIIRSSDGMNWEVVFQNIDIRFFDVVATEAGVLAVGNRLASPVTGVIVRSTLGSDGSFQELETPATVASIVYTGEKFVASVYKGAILTSSDGLSWEVGDLGIWGTIRRLEWNGKEFVGIGVWYLQGHVIVRSEDAITWDVVLYPDIDFADIAWTGQLWVIAGDQYIFTSRDGVDWEREKSGFGAYLFCLAGRFRQLVAFYGSAILGANHSTPEPRRPGGRQSPFR